MVRFQDSLPAEKAADLLHKKLESFGLDLEKGLAAITTGRANAMKKNGTHTLPCAWPSSCCLRYFVCSWPGSWCKTDCSGQGGRGIGWWRWKRLQQYGGNSNLCFWIQWCDQESTKNCAHFLMQSYKKWSIAEVRKATHRQEACP